MPIQVLKTLYEFHELSDSAKDKARDWYRQASATDDFEWDYIRDDAKQIGLEIIQLDARGVNKGKFTKSMPEVIAAITTEHGTECKTFITAGEYTQRLNELEKESEQRGDAGEDTFYEALQELEKEFLQSLLEDYLHQYEAQIEYINSDEAVDESIQANNYTFDENGKRAD